MTSTAATPTTDRRPSIERRDTPSLPTPRGPISEALVAALRTSPETSVPVTGSADARLADPLGEDATLALYTLYELHYRGFDEVDARWEWDPRLLALRGALERSFEAAVRELVGDVPETDDVVGWLEDQLVHTPDPARSIAGWCKERGDLVHLREQAVHRSPYQLKEADPHSWGLPRLTGRAKAALIEIQYDEYGEGRVADQHAELFALHLDRLGLDPSYGAYVDLVPGAMLATVNLVSMFGLHRRLRGALVGHLACFEMASVPVMSDLATATRRLGFDEWTSLFYDVHVVADARHQTLAAVDLAGGLVADHPSLLEDVLFGVLALGSLEARSTQHILEAWQEGRSSLRQPLPDDLPTPGRTDRYEPGRDPRTARVEERHTT